MGSGHCAGPTRWVGGGLWADDIFPPLSVLSLPWNTKTLSWSREVMFLFIVAAALTDISVQLNKGREHIKYFTAPKQWIPLSLVPHLRGNVFRFSLLRMLVVGLSYMTYIIMFRFISSVSTFWRAFIINGCWILSKAFTASIEMIIVFILQFTNVVNHTDWFVGIEESLHPWDKSQFIFMYVPFNTLLTANVLIYLVLLEHYWLETYQYVFREWYNYHHHAKLFKSLKLIKGLLYNLWLSLSFTFCCIRFLFQFCVYYKCKIFKNDASWNNE